MPIIVDSIFSYLFENKQYFDQILPHLEGKYFDFDESKRLLLNQIKHHQSKFNKQSSYDDIKLSISTDRNITVQEKKAIILEIDRLQITPAPDLNFDLLLEQTEEWVKDRAMEIAISESAEIITTKEKPRSTIEALVREALLINFNHNLGLEYITDWQKMLQFYKMEESKIPFKLDTYNEMFNGGLRRKAIHLVAGRPGIGKTLLLSDFSAQLLSLGNNVVYISGEMSEAEIYTRHDANLLNIKMDDLSLNLEEKIYKNKISEFITDNPKKGQLFVKEYPTGTASKTHIISYLNELKLTHDFTPDVVIIDYVNIFRSSVLPVEQMSDSYRYVKAVMEEFRALAVEMNIAVLSGVQFNRVGSSNGASETDDTSLSDSYGIAMTADFISAIIQSESLKEEGKYLNKVIKTRFSDNKHFIYTTMVDYSYMRLSDPLPNQKEISEAEKERLEQMERFAQNQAVSQGAIDDEGESIFYFGGEDDKM